MKRKSDLYEKIINKDNLKQADKIARRGKQKQYGVQKHIKNKNKNTHNGWLVHANTINLRNKYESITINTK